MNSATPDIHTVLRALAALERQIDESLERAKTPEQRAAEARVRERRARRRELIAIINATSRAIIRVTREGREFKVVNSHTGRWKFCATKRDASDFITVSVCETLCLTSDDLVEYGVSYGECMRLGIF